MTFTTITLKQDGPVLRVTLRNPPVNLLSLQMTAELFQLAERLQCNSAIKVVVFESADPNFFLSHVDFRELRYDANRSQQQTVEIAESNRLQALGLRWQALPQVTIAKISGYCRGAGLEFVMGLIMRFATRDAKLCFPEASSGYLAGGGGVTRTALAAGGARAMEILLSARDFTGEEAERYGLVNRALSFSELTLYVDDLTRRLAKRSTAVIALHREVLSHVNQHAEASMAASLAAESEALQTCYAGTEMCAVIDRLIQTGQTRQSEVDLPDTIARLRQSFGESREGASVPLYDTSL